MQYRGRMADDGKSADAPEVLFVCVHNAGRSQMAAAFTDRLSKGRVSVRSAGSEPAPGALQPARGVGGFVPPRLSTFWPSDSPETC